MPILPRSDFVPRFHTLIDAEKLKLFEELGTEKVIPLPPCMIHFFSRFKGSLDNHHIEIYPCLLNTDRLNQVSYVFLHGYTFGKSVVRIYKLSQDVKRMEAEFELIQNDLVLNDSAPKASWHSQTTLTQKGVLFFWIHGEGQPNFDGTTGPFSTKLMIMDFASQKVETLHQFQIQGRSDECRGVYLLNSISGRALEFDSVEQFLEQNYFVVSTHYNLTLRNLS